MKKIPGSGRVKGTPNKKKWIKISELLAEKDIHPGEEILAILNNEDVRPADQIKAWLELLSYCEVKPKENESARDEEESEIDSELESLSDAQLIRLVKNEVG